VLRAELPLAAPAPADPQAWVDRALAQNPGLLAQQRSVDAAERAIGAARAGHAPTLTAGLGVGRSALWPAVATGNDPGNGRTATSVGLLLTVPLFSGGAVDSKVRQAFAQRDGTRDQLEAQRRRLARETLDRYRSINAGIGQIQAGVNAVAAARKALESTRVGLSLGTQTMTDLLLAIQTLSGAQDALTQARQRYVLGGLQLLQSAGAIGEFDLAAVNALLE
jgi:outer membrane protein